VYQVGNNKKVRFFLCCLVYVNSVPVFINLVKPGNATLCWGGLAMGSTSTARHAAITCL